MKKVLMFKKINIKRVHYGSNACGGGSNACGVEK